MLADPFGNRLVPSTSPMPGQGRVEILVEVCDPPEDDAFAYQVNGVLVSDFYTPRYFDPVKRPEAAYDFSGAITSPREVLRGGYLSWHNPTDDHWYQEIFFDGSEPQFRDLGVLSRGKGSLREMIDALTPQTRRLSTLTQESDSLRASLTATATGRDATTARATSLRAQIRDLTAEPSMGSAGAPA